MGYGRPETTPSPRVAPHATPGTRSTLSHHHRSAVADPRADGLPRGGTGAQGTSARGDGPGERGHGVTLAQTRPRRGPQRLARCATPGPPLRGDRDIVGRVARRRTPTTPELGMAVLLIALAASGRALGRAHGASRLRCNGPARAATGGPWAQPPPAHDPPSGPGICAQKRRSQPPATIATPARWVTMRTQAMSVGCPPQGSRTCGRAEAPSITRRAKRCWCAAATTAGGTWPNGCRRWLTDI